MQIEHAQETRGVIVLPILIFRRKIRKSLWKLFLRQNMLFAAHKLNQRKGSLGVEHASDAAILEALKRS